MAVLSAALSFSSAVAWQNEISGGSPTYADAVTGIALDPAGDVVAVGLLRRDVTGGDRVVAVGKLSGRTGAVLWRREVGDYRQDARGGIGGGPLKFHDHGVAVDATGDVIVAGFLDAAALPSVAKLAGSDGHVLWQIPVTTVPPPVPPMSSYHGLVVSADAASS